LKIRTLKGKIFFGRGESMHSTHHEKDGIKIKDNNKQINVVQ
jgi:hypothetical protein